MTQSEDNARSSSVPPRSRLAVVSSFAWMGVTTAEESRRIFKRMFILIDFVLGEMFS